MQTRSATISVCTCSNLYNSFCITAFVQLIYTYQKNLYNSFFLLLLTIKVFVGCQYHNWYWTVLMLFHEIYGWISFHYWRFMNPTLLFLFFLSLTGLQQNKRFGQWRIVGAITIFADAALSSYRLQGIFGDIFHLLFWIF